MQNIPVFPIGQGIAALNGGCAIGYQIFPLRWFIVFFEEQHNGVGAGRPECFTAELSNGMNPEVFQEAFSGGDITIAGVA